MRCDFMSRNNRLCVIQNLRDLPHLFSSSRVTATSELPLLLFLFFFWLLLSYLVFCYTFASLSRFDFRKMWETPSKQISTAFVNLFHYLQNTESASKQSVEGSLSDINDNNKSKM